MNMNKDTSAIMELFLEQHPSAKERDIKEWFHAALVWAVHFGLVSEREAIVILSLSELPKGLRKWSNYEYLVWKIWMKQEGHWQ